MNEPLLKVQGLQASYGDMQALWDISFEVSRGEIVTLVGSNGAGKTTTLKTIAGLLRPRAGRIEFEGQELGGQAAHRIVGCGIALVPEGRQVWPDMTVRENLELGAYAAAARPKRDATLKYVFDLFPRLYERRWQKAGTLSGGEQQMLAIGRGLLSQPRLLMLDEPSLGLAPVIVREVLNVIRLVQSQGVTVLLVEQNVNYALTVANRAYVLEQGRVRLTGAASELLHDEHVRRTYLGA